jgi:hypothetical protein
MKVGFRERFQAWRQRRQSRRRLAEAVKCVGASELSRLIDQPDRLFEAAFRLNAWQGRESRSGRGSDLDNTEAIRAALPPMLMQFGVRRLLDIPCGDFFWLQHVPLDLDCYIGADRVAALIAHNRERHSAAKRTFIVCDIVRDPLPPSDLVLCRDLLVHLCHADIHRALHNIRRSGADWLLTTQFTATSRANPDILTGDWRPLNLCLPPFRLPQPELLIDECYVGEEGRWRDKHLALWPTSALP